MMRKKGKTGLLTTLVVYKNQVQIGTGWVVWHEGKNHRPNLMTNEGAPLDEGWFDLVAIEQHLVVINRSIH